MRIARVKLLGFVGGIMMATAILPAEFQTTGLSVVSSANAQTVLGSAPQVIQAVEAGDLEALKGLLIRGENLDTVDIDGRNGVILAARNGDVDVLNFLAENNASINWQDEVGNTALHWVSQDGDTFVVEELLALGADPNVRNRSGQTPIMVAAREGYADIVGVYLDKGVDLTIRDYTGRSVLDWARDSRSRQIEPLLLNAGAQ